MHLFAGAGGGLLCDLILGHKPIIAVEWDKYACSVLRARAADGWFPDLSVWEGDVRMFNPSEYAGKVDCIHAGFPCQDISVAGKQAGVGEETRSGLYREVLRIADVVRPGELFLENVSAILSNGLGTVLADISTRGYVARWICVRASDVGANHQRDRWWLLARKLGNAKHDGQPASKITGSIKQGNDGSKTRQEQASESTRPGEQYEELAYSSNKGLQGREIAGDNGENRTQSRNEQLAGCGTGNQWNAVESDVGRVAHDVADRVGKLKALGNGQVPLQAAVAYSILERLFNDTTK